MGMIGTGPAAGVAQTALLAQQAARERDAQYHTRAQQAARMRQLLHARLKAQDEDATGADATDLQIDGQMQQHDPDPAQQASAYEPAHKEPPKNQPASEEPTSDPPDPDTPGHHLDIEA